MIDPPDGLSGNGAGADTFNGVCPNCITVRALVPGGALIDGQYARVPVNLNQNSWFVLEDFNVRHGGALSSARSYLLRINDSTNNIVRRIVGWDKLITKRGSSFWFDGSNHLGEDLGVFGTGAFARIGNNNQCSGCRFRRTWVRTEASLDRGNPFTGYTFNYDSHNTLIENALGTLDMASQPQRFQVHSNGQPYDELVLDGYLANNVQASVIQVQDASQHCTNTKIYGGLMYITPGADTRQTGMLIRANNSRTIQCYHVHNSAMVISPSNPRFDDIRGFGLGHQDTNNTINKSTSIRGTIGNLFGDGWTVNNLASGTRVASVPNVWTNTGPNGANLCKRYKNGVLTNEPLWPWPMNERIKAATAMAGKYTGGCPSPALPSGVCELSSGVPWTFPTRAAVDVTADIEALLGPIPSQCRTDR